MRKKMPTYLLDLIEPKYQEDFSVVLKDILVNNFDSENWRVSKFLHKIGCSEDEQDKICINLKIMLSLLHIDMYLGTVAQKDKEKAVSSLKSILEIVFEKGGGVFFDMESLDQKIVSDRELFIMNAGAKSILKVLEIIMKETTPESCHMALTNIVHFFSKNVFTKDGMLIPDLMDELKKL